MRPLLVCILSLLLVIAAESKELVTVRGKQKLILESVETDCDHNFVEYFKKVDNNEILHTFRVVKKAPAFSISIVMRSLKSKRIMYNVNKLDGCQFLNNRILNKVLEANYRKLVVNNSFFKCPIAPKVYFLKSLDKALMMPSFHPAGRYQLCARIQMSLSTAPFVMEIVWTYNIIHLT